MDGHTSDEAYQPLDSQLYSSLLPTLLKLYDLSSSGVEPSRQLEIARMASGLRESLARAQKQAQDLPGAELTLAEQEEIIAVLEREVKKRNG